MSEKFANKICGMALERRMYRPYKVESKKFGMWLFILSDALTFSAVIMAYAYIRVSTPEWPQPFNADSVVTASIMTFLLLSSSITMVMAVNAAQRGLRTRAALWIVAQR